MFLCDHTNLFYRHQRTNLIICRHNGNQNRFRCDCFFQIFQTDPPIFIHIQIGHLCPLFFQPLAGMQNRMVFHLCGDNMISLVPVSFVRFLNRPVICLCTAGGKINFIGFCPDHICNLFSCFIYRFFADSCQFIYTGRISIVLGKIGKHSFHYLRRGLCRSRIIHINCFLHILLPPVLTAQSLHLSFFFDFSALFYQLIQIHGIYRIRNTGVNFLPDVPGNTEICIFTASLAILRIAGHSP